MSTTVDDIFKRKAERRRNLAALPFARKIEIVKQLQEFARETAPFRKLHREQKFKARGAL